MYITILDKAFSIIAVLEETSSVIWVDRYDDVGDFELHLPMNRDLFLKLQLGTYLSHKGSDRLMLIKSVQISTETSTELIVKGLSAETILSQRIIAEQTTLSGSLQNGIQLLLNENLISPSDPKRTIPNIVFDPSTDQRVLDALVEGQWTGDNLLEVIKKLCATNGLGFKLILDEANIFHFSIYAGTHRTFAQSDVPYVTFSPSFDNLVSSLYLITMENFANVANVFGEGAGSERIAIQVTSDEEEPEGLDRFEMYVDARDISSTISGGTLTLEQYIELLAERGFEKLSEVSLFELFEGEVDSTNSYLIGRDYFLGDVLQIANEWGLTGQSRVSAVTFYENTSGIKILPKFVRL